MRPEELADSDVVIPSNLSHEELKDEFRRRVVDLRNQLIEEGKTEAEIRLFFGLPSLQ